MSNEKFKVKFGLAVGDSTATIDAATGNINSNGNATIAGTMTANSFSPVEVAPSAELVEAVKFITAAALFGNTVEKFAGKFTGGSNDSQAGE